MRDRVAFFTGIDFRDVGPGWAERAVANLEADVAAGAVGCQPPSALFSARRLSRAFSMSIVAWVSASVTISTDSPSLGMIAASSLAARIDRRRDPKKPSRATRNNFV